MKELPYLRQKPRKFLFDGCKLLWHQDKLQDFLDNKRITPIHIDMGIHKGCNIKCTYCYGIKQHPSAKYIPTEQLMHLADDAKAVGVRSLAIIGDGEPTLNKGLYPFVRKLRENRVDVAVATNGLLLGKEDIDTLTSSLTWLRFNISAVKNYEKVHKGAHRYGGLKQFIKVVEGAVKHKGDCTIGLQAVLVPDGFEDIVNLADLAKNLGVDYLVIKQFSDPEELIPVRFDIEKKYAEAMGALLEAQQRDSDETKIIVKWRAMHDSASISKHAWDFKQCIDLPFIFQISGNGDCYPCGYLFGEKDYCYGSVVTGRLREIVFSGLYWKIIEKVAKTPLSKLCKGQCRHCETLKFMDRLTGYYDGNLQEALVKMCGSLEQYNALMARPPQHLNFV